MRLLVDECLPQSLAEELSELQCDVGHVANKFPSALDEQIVEYAVETQRIIVSEDRDFGLLAFRDGHPPPGIVLLYASRFQLPKVQLMQHFARRILELDAQLEDHITIIEPGRTRQRKLVND